MTPTQLDGKDFEAIIVAACEKLPGVSIARYGTKAVTIEDAAASKVAGRRVLKTLAVPSLPDFDIAVAPQGRQVIIEAKVCGVSTFAMNKDKIKPSQVAHMLERAAVGVPCWLLIHWTERIAPASRRCLDPAMTIALPVGDMHPRWQQFVNAHAVAKKLKTDPQPQPAITRAESLEQGFRISWHVPHGCRNAVPDLAPLLGIETRTQPSLL